MKQVIVIRKDLNMRKGKMVAQGAHASMAAILDHGEVSDHPAVREWLDGRFTKICVSAKNLAELLAIYDKACEANIPCSLITDSGLTEFHGELTDTAVAVGPGPENVIDKITGHLKLL